MNSAPTKFKTLREKFIAKGPSRAYVNMNLRWTTLQRPTICSPANSTGNNFTNCSWESCTTINNRSTGKLHRLSCSTLPATTNTKHTLYRGRSMARDCMTKKTMPSPRSFPVATILVLLPIFLICGFFAFIAVNSMRTQLRPNTKEEQALLGTWLGESGNILNFRSDRTARTLLNNGPAYGFLEWTCNSREFQYTMYSEPYGVGWYVRRLTMDETPTDRFKVIDISRSEFRIQSRDGKTHVFTRIQNPSIEAVP